MKRKKDQIQVPKKIQDEKGFEPYSRVSSGEDSAPISCNHIETCKFQKCEALSERGVQTRVIVLALELKKTGVAFPHDSFFEPGFCILSNEVKVRVVIELRLLLFFF